MYAIRFDFPEGDVLFAAKYKDSLGWSQTLEAAMLVETKEEAQRWIDNGYEANREHASIIPVQAAGAINEVSP